MSAGEIAANLEGIYVFCKRLLMEARFEQDADKVEKVRELLGPLRESWAQIAGVTSA
jgi:flagellin-specific chaperone FliS